MVYNIMDLKWTIKQQYFWIIEASFWEDQKPKLKYKVCHFFPF